MKLIPACTIGTYAGFKSIVMESDLIRLETVPEIGGKLVSILYKPTGMEWLLSSGSRRIRQPIPGSVFGDWDMSGWDECFPTINSCPSGIEEGVSFPDHGELWSLPWECSIEGGTVTGSVRSPRLPYQFTRILSFPAADRIRLDYRADNLGDGHMPFLWVPHPQFAITEPTRILLPESMKEMQCVFEGHSLKNGEIYDWNEVSFISPAVTGDGRKLYYPGKVPAGCSGLYGEESGNFLILSVSADKVPYLGIWVDEGMFNDRVTCALEPSIGYYDSLEMAAGNGTAQILQPQSSFSWHVELTLGAGADNIDNQLRSGRTL